MICARKQCCGLMTGDQCPRLVEWSLFNRPVSPRLDDFTEPKLLPTADTCVPCLREHGKVYHQHAGFSEWMVSSWPFATGRRNPGSLEVAISSPQTCQMCSTPFQSAVQPGFANTNRPHSTEREYHHHYSQIYDRARRWSRFREFNLTKGHMLTA